MELTNFYQITTVVIAVAAICSPIITAIINNWHDTKIKRMEMQQSVQHDYTLHVREIFEKYIKAAGKVVTSEAHSALSDYGEYYSLALHYASTESVGKMKQLHSLVTSRSWEAAQLAIADVSMQLRADTAELRTPPQL